MNYKTTYEDLPDGSKVLNAVVTKTTLGIEDHGCLSSFIYVDRQGGCSQGFGGWALHLPPSFTHHELKSVAGHFICRVLDVCGVESWDKVAGKAVRICEKGGRLVAIGHIINDDWFIPKSDFEQAIKE